MAGQWQGGQWQPEENVQRNVQPNVRFPQFTESPGQYGQQQYPGQYPQPPQFPYPPQYGPPQPPPRKSRKGLAAIGCLGLGGLVVIIAAVAASHPSSSSSPSALPTLPTVAVSSAAQAAAKGTVTYEVTGSPADVTYGPAGSNFSGTVPLSKTGPLGSPMYYAVSAQLQGGGTVTCKILIDGKVISRSTASGSYNIADCEVSQDPLTGAWSDTNGS